jgi:diguanylate cyclase (GGDEF)-like protein
MTQYLQVSALATLVQVAGTVLVAGLLVPLSRAMPGQFLRLWAVGWLLKAAGLCALLLHGRGPAEFRLPLLSAYLLGSYGFAFLVWAGCRKLSDGLNVRPRDGVLMAGPAAFAVCAPVVYGGAVWRLFPVHAAVLAGLFLLALSPAARLPGRATGPAVGRWVVRLSLGLLCGLFAHYTVVIGYLGGGSPAGFEYLAFASLYDVLLETALAFGMVVLAADRTRELLEGQNRALATAAAELAAVARTDPLTGLLNRRGFEQVLADHDAHPTGGAVAVLDVNDLKPLNDRFGHPAGDAALQLVARALRGRFRVTDPVCRVGGDEFVVVLPDGTPADLCRRLAGLELELAERRLPGVPDPTDVGVAWGVAGFTADLPRAVVAADRAMYTRKATMKAGQPVAV